MTEPRIVSTEPKALPKDERCPQCRAWKDKRTASGFGQRFDICSQCGYEFEEFTQ